MPQGQGYSGRGRGYSGGVRSNYQYDNRQPAAFQYQSFYDPIPVDALAGSSQRSQLQYDTAYTGALAAKEKALQEEVALTDAIYRKDLVEGKMKNMEQIATDKYGGDYGRAAKDIAKEITNLRANPFWQSSAHLKEQQAAQQKFMLENPDAHLFRDVSKLGAANIDPETGEFLGIRSPEELSFEAKKHGDWQGSVEKQFADWDADRTTSFLKSIPGLEGYHGKVSLEQLTTEQMYAVLDNQPEMIEAFLENNPDFEESKRRLGGIEDAAGIREEAKKFIAGNILDKAVSRRDVTPVRDLSFDPDAGSGGGGGGLIFSNTSPDFQLTANKQDINKRTLNDLNGEMWSRSTMAPDDPRRAEIEERAQNVYDRVDLVTHSVQSNSAYGLSQSEMDKTYQDAVKASTNVTIPPMTSDEIQKEVMDHIRHGTDPDPDIYGDEKDVTAGTAYPGVTPSGESTVTNPIATLVNDMRSSMKKAVKDEKGIAANANILKGTSGRKDLDTVINNLEGVATNMWTEQASNFIIANTGQQAEAWLDEEYPTGSKDKQRDRSQDRIAVLDTPINGKLSFVLTTHNSKGDRLVTIPVAPKDQGNITNNMMRVARESMRLGYPEQGKTILANTIFRPAMQNAKIHDNPSGTISLPTGPVEYKQVGTIDNPKYQMFIKQSDGTEDYFRGTETGPPLEYSGEEDMLQSILDSFE